MDSAALLAHIVAQTRQNIEFLIAQNQISPNDGRDILLKLPKATSSNTSVSDLVHRTQSLSVSPQPSVQSSIVTPAYTPSPVNTTPSYQPPPQPHNPHTLFRAKAIWDYNLNGQDPNDLSFRAGDIIDIVNETNADWWTGSHNAKQGLFPSNYVEKLPPAALPSPALSQYSEKVATPGGGPGYPMVPTYSAYQPTGGYQGPPPPTQGGYSPYGAAPATALAPVEQHPPTAAHEQNPGKKGKLGGKLGNTLAHSAVGGVGFGAGSAIGSGIINSIF